MPVLHLGVMDIPYTYEEKRKNRKGKLRNTTSLTTGDVAEILESKYHIMEVFFEEYREKITEMLLESAAGSLENMIMGAPPTNPYAAGTQQIDEMFKNFILSQEIERLGIPGTPTQAALEGVSHRRAHPYKKGNPRRPSFFDTGAYVDNFMSWID